METGKKQLEIETYETGYKMPATIITGAKQGPTVLICAGLHSGEYPGIVASINLVNDIDPKLLSGKLIVVHCVNPSGFFNKTSAVVYEDNGNLNNIFPGNPDGTISYQIADYFVKKIFPKVDFVVDLHSGGAREPLSPCLFFPINPQVKEKSLKVAKSLNIPYLIASSATKGLYSYASNVLNIPGLLLERGSCGRCLPSWVVDYQTDLLLLLNSLDVYPGLVKQDKGKRLVFNRTIYLTAKHQGIWISEVSENSFVTKNQLLGYIMDFTGKIIEQYYALDDGIVFYYTSGLPVKPGSALVAYGLMSFVE